MASFDLERSELKTGKYKLCDIQNPCFKNS